MTPIEALILGILQGLTEFFPISSSAHLKLGEFFLGLKNLQDYLLFDLICHFGTLFAVVAVLWRPITKLFSEDRKTLWQLCVATLPLFPLVLIIKPLRALFGEVSYLGFAMMLNGCFLAFCLKKSAAITPQLSQQRRWRDAWIIGTAQACAAVPGISRSGSTISTAWLLGWNTENAITFSFLLSIPAILGGITYECLKLMTTQVPFNAPPIGLLPYAIGFVSSFLVGIVCFLLLLRLFTRERFYYFAWYCLAIGAALVIYFNASYWTHV